LIVTPIHLNDETGIAKWYTGGVNSQPDTTLPRTKPRGKLLQALGVLILALALNVLVLLLPSHWFDGWGKLGYLGVFVVTLLANASVFIPVPYPGIVAKLATHLNVGGVAVLGAAGSSIGEATAFLVGRAGKGVVEETRFFHWLRHQLRTPLRAFVVLFVLSAPPNPFFDIAGLTAGSLGVPFPIFLLATFSGRIVRMLILASLGQTYLRG
jgi:membrane protein YqaA with SNARE-associated domain